MLYLPYLDKLFMTPVDIDFGGASRSFDTVLIWAIIRTMGPYFLCILDVDLRAACES